MSAWQNKLSDRVGSIAPGRLADFTILAVAVADPQRLADMRVMATIVGDRPVYGFVPGSEALADAPRASYVQPTEAVVAVVTGTSPMTPAEGQNDIQEKTLGAYAFTADVRDGIWPFSRCDSWATADRRGT